jgi:hypothetical protein
MATTKKKTVPKKAATSQGKSRSTAAKQAKPAGPREEAIANDVLKLVDQAAGLLRKAIRSGAQTSQTRRLEAKQQAHTLLTKASSTLGQVIDRGTSTLHNIINRI